MREGAGIDALFKLACYADLIVLLDSVSPRSQVIDQSREGIKSLQYRKDFSRDLIGLEYEVDPNNPDESDDGQLGFIHIAFDRMVTTPKPSSHLILYLGMLYLKLTAKNLTRTGLC
ncbi:hypothetical protein FOFC_03695 [Fusarium oxysporum]|nr:hypothetical protein FOFC_03695 [Fusarium oxysporum]